ncbi:Uncharacterised protein [Yokenella regensburgei]|nr:Uncharacterised protein [Yokenella regensburgei]SUQ07437.1 Uncharacterised protein [Yokenella regensburgei]
MRIVKFLRYTNEQIILSNGRCFLAKISMGFMVLLRFTKYLLRQRFFFFVWCTWVKAIFVALFCF